LPWLRKAQNRTSLGHSQVVFGTIKKEYAIRQVGRLGPTFPKARLGVRHAESQKKGERWNEKPFSSLPTGWDVEMQPRGR